MPVSLSPTDESAVVLRLRAAGCVFAEDEAELLLAAAQTAAQLEELLEMRVAGQPLEHVVGWADFCGLRIAVAAGIFVPRQRSEFLVEQAAARLAPGAVLIDMCCGSGALGAVLCAAVGGVDLHATDIDAAAVRCAGRNVAACGGRVYRGDLFEALPSRLKGTVDMVVANVPYVPSGDVEFLPREARLYEPRLALDGGPDGLDVARRVASGAPQWLAPGGHLLVEATRRQAPVVADIFARRGLSAAVEHSDELDATVVVGTSAGR